MPQTLYKNVIEIEKFRGSQSTDKLDFLSKKGIFPQKKRNLFRIKRIYCSNYIKN